MTLSAINNKWEVLCHQSIQPKHSAFLPALSALLYPIPASSTPENFSALQVWHFAVLTNTKLFVHVCLFSIPRQQFGKSWMNTKVMKWRSMLRANIWQGQFSSYSFPLPAKNSAWILNLCILHAGCGRRICKRSLILKENGSISLPE